MTIALVAIVKNEVKALPRLFESVKDIVDEAVIVDTGSTDGTQDYLRSNEIPVTLLERPWVNMAVNRSQVLEAARGRADWLLMLDADMTVVGKPEGLDPAVDAYLLRIQQGSMEFWVERLLRGDREWAYEGAAHEFLVAKDGPYQRERLPGFEVRHHADGTNRATKYERSCAALEAEIAEGKNVPRDTFYLAQNYRDMRRTEESIALYRQRVGMQGWAEETFYAQFMVGKLSGSLYDLLKAHWMRPTRREPLVELARLALRRAASTPPSEDILFVNNAVPQFVMWERQGYGTLIPPLVWAITEVSGPVLEMGAGDWSTPLLHQMCFDRDLVTVEANAGWRTRYAAMMSERHRFVETLSPEITQRRWGVVLIDHALDRRAADLLMLDADLYVVHDTQPGAVEEYPGLAEALDHFEYRVDFTDLMPWTTIVSNNVVL